MALVREDDEGIYVISGGVKARPGAVLGYGHAYRMDDGGLSKGDKVAASHVGGTPMVRLKLPDGTVTRWFCQDSRREDEKMEADPDAVWDDKGVRTFPKEDHACGTSAPRRIHAIEGSDIMKELGL
jgi:hypothetical protein